MRVAPVATKTPIPRHERLQHVRYQRHGIDCLAVDLCV
nr:hypothetical protein [uncultured bacterium]